MKLKYYCLCVLALSLLGCDEFFKKDSKKDYNKNKAPRVNVPNPNLYTPPKYNNTNSFSPVINLNAWSVRYFKDEFGDIQLNEKYLEYKNLSTSNNSFSKKMRLMITESGIEFRFTGPNNPFDYTVSYNWRVKIKYKDGSTSTKSLKTYK